MRKIGVGTFTVTQAMREQVLEVLDSNRISYGPKCKKFEHEFAAMHGCSHGMLSNSGTSSLQVALQALKERHDWPDGSQVIVPASTFVATVNVVLHNQLQPVLVDIDPLYYEIDAKLIADAIGPVTRAIIPVHLYGQPCDMTAVMGVANEYGLRVIEDSCECMFVGWKGQRVGSFGDVGCFSTYVAHLLTSGVGGIAITNDSELAVRMRSLVNHGRDGIYISIDDGNSKEVVKRRFNFTSIGHSYRITELEAALALPQLDTWVTMISRRQHNAKMLTAGLKSLEAQGLLQLPAVRPGASHAYMMYPIVVVGESKWPLCYYLEKYGIETREMLRLTDQPAYADMFDPSAYPVAEKINAGGFYVGCHQDLDDDDLSCIVNVIQQYFDGERS